MESLCLLVAIASLFLILPRVLGSISIGVTIVTEGSKVFKVKNNLKETLSFSNSIELIKLFRLLITNFRLIYEFQSQ
jgi:hypothetical protein